MPTQEFTDAVNALVTAAKAKGAAEFQAANPPVDEATVTAQAQAEDLAAVHDATANLGAT